MLKLNYEAFKQAESIILHGKVDMTSTWAKVMPPTDVQSAFQKKLGLEEYAKWFLAYDADEPEDSPKRFHHLIGDFDKVHRSALLAIRAVAEKENDNNILIAVKELMRQVDKEPDTVDIASDDSFPASDPPPH